MMAWICKVTLLSINLHQHVIALDLDWKAPHRFTGRWLQHFSGLDVKLGSMPGAGDDISSQFALPQWPTLVCTGVFDGINGASHVEKGNALSLGIYSLAGPWQYLIRFSD